MRRDLDEDRLDADVGVLCCEARQEVKLLLDLLDRLTLVGDDLQGRRELTLAHKGHHLHGCLLLRLADQVRVLARDVLERVARDGDVVDGEGLRLEDTGRQRAVLKACQHVPAHTEINILRLEVAEAVEFLVDNLLDLFPN